MQVSLEVICEHLQKQYPQFCQEIPESLRRKKYRAPVLCPKNGSLSQHKLYVISSDQWSNLGDYASENAAICVGPPPADYIGASVVLPETLSLLEVYAAVSQIFASFSKLRSSLERCIQCSSSLQGLVVTAGQWTQNPITVCDEDNIVLAQYTQDKSYRPFNQETMVGKRIPDAWMGDSIQIELVRETGQLYYARSMVGTRECDCCAISISRSNQIIAHISIASYVVPLRESDGLILSILAPFVKQAMPENKTVNSVTLFSVQSAFRSILQDSVPNKQNIERCLLQYDMKISDRYLSIVLQINWTWDMKLPVDYICSQIQKHLKRGCCFIHDNNLVAFVNLDALSAEVPAVIAKLQPMIKKYNFKAGCSNVFYDAFQAEIYYTQALVAVETGNEICPEKRIYHFDDYALDHFLRYGTTRLSGRNISSYKLLQLEESDTENGTEYINTLRAFFDNEMSPTKAAQALYIHRTTFLYRLERIQKVFQVDWSDPRQRLYLTLSLELL